MRIIGGAKGRLKIPNTNKLKVRPTKDIAKESLFNILNSKINYDGCCALDLFAGTGAISYELASRGASKITSVDISSSCIKFIYNTIKLLKIDDKINPIKADCIQFIKNQQSKYNLIFADPPYNFTKYEDLINIIFSSDLLYKNGLLVVEHTHTNDLERMPKFIDKRKYGKSAFSFFHNI